MSQDSERHAPTNVCIATTLDTEQIETMDRNELELLRSFVSDEIFQFLTTGCDKTQPTNSAYVDPTDPLKVELDSLLLQ